MTTVERDDGLVGRAGGFVEEEEAVVRGFGIDEVVADGKNAGCRSTIVFNVSSVQLLGVHVGR